MRLHILVLFLPYVVNAAEPATSEVPTETQQHLTVKPDAINSNRKCGQVSKIHEFGKVPEQIPVQTSDSNLILRWKTLIPPPLPQLRPVSNKVNIVSKPIPVATYEPQTTLSWKIRNPWHIPPPWSLFRLASKKVINKVVPEPNPVPIYEPPTTEARACRPAFIEDSIVPKPIPIQYYEPQTTVTWGSPERLSRPSPPPPPQVHPASTITPEPIPAQTCKPQTTVIPESPEASRPNSSPQSQIRPASNEVTIVPEPIPIQTYTRQTTAISESPEPHRPTSSPQSQLRPASNEITIVPEPISVQTYEPQITVVTSENPEPLQPSPLPQLRLRPASNEVTILPEPFPVTTTYRPPTGVTSKTPESRPILPPRPQLRPTSNKFTIVSEPVPVPTHGARTTVTSTTPEPRSIPPPRPQLRPTSNRVTILPKPIPIPAYDPHTILTWNRTEPRYIPPPRPQLRPALHEVTIVPEPIPITSSGPQLMARAHFQPASEPISVYQDENRQLHSEIYPIYYRNPDLIDYVCSDEYNYYAVDNKCNHYIECKKYKAVEFICPNGLHFNPEAKWQEYPCTDPAFTACKTEIMESLPTKMKIPEPLIVNYKCFDANNYYGIENECQSFIECKNFIATKYICPDGFQFNPKATWPLNPCTVATEDRCLITTPPNSTVNLPVSNEQQSYQIITDYICAEENKYYTINSDCESYVQCEKYIPYAKKCPNGLYFDIDAKYPDYPCCSPSEAQCTIAPNKEKIDPALRCPRRNGFFALQDGECSKYIMCQGYHPHVMNCPTGLVFNYNLDSCDWPVNVPSCNIVNE